MQQDTLYIVIPAYNEEETIERVVRDWHAVAAGTGPDARLVVVNDGSKDATLSRLLALREELPALVPLTKENGGHGAAVLYGYRYALSHGADYVFQTDSDGQTLPEEFGPFWDLRGGYAAVIGHRRGRQDGFSRVVVTKTLKLVLLLTFHVRVTDANTPFRLMKADALRRCMSMLPEDYNLPNAAISALLVKGGEPVKFLPITFRPRQGGVNSINLRRIAGIGLRAAGDFLRIEKTMRKRSRTLKPR